MYLRPSWINRGLQAVPSQNVFVSFPNEAVPKQDSRQIYIVAIALQNTSAGPQGLHSLSQTLQAQT